MAQLMSEVIAEVQYMFFLALFLGIGFFILTVVFCVLLEVVRLIEIYMRVRVDLYEDKCIEISNRKFDRFVEGLDSND
jgi:hypothetical protein